MLQFITLIEPDHSADTQADYQICLTMDERTKSRLKVTLSNGLAAGLGETAIIIAAKETVSTVITEDPLLLARVCYHLGNRHVPLQVEQGWCRYQHDHVLDDMVRGLGAQVIVEQEKYQPEPGAYGGWSSSPLTI